MSSILKALKKLENENPAQEIQGQHLPHSINTRQTVNKRVKGFWIVNKLFSTMCIVIITLGLIWFALNYKPDNKPDNKSDNKPVYQSNISAEIPKTSAEKEPELKHPENKGEPESIIPRPEIKNVYSSAPKPAKIIENRKPVPQPKKINPFQKAVPQPKIHAKKVQAPNPSPEKINPVPKEMPRQPIEAPAAEKQVKKHIKPEIVNQKEKDNQDSTLSDVRTVTTPVQPVHDSIPEKSASESGLEIQALVWSPESRSRMAVINGNILREGGVIDGTFINYIGNDYIIIKKENKEWKLIFQIN